MDGDTPLTGTWVLRSFVHSNNANPFNNICSVSEDSLFVFFTTPFEVFNISDNGDNTATVIVSPLTETFTYLWDDPEGSTTATTGIIDESGTYNVTITNSLGCTITSSVEVNSTVSIEDVESLVKMEINPNPTSGDFNINLELAQSEKIQIDLISVTGQKVKTITNETSRGNMYQVKASELPAGLYFINFNVSGSNSLKN